jgi:hypothetical protein
LLRLAAPLKALVARAASTASLAAIGLTLGGERLLPLIGVHAPPEFVKSMQAAKLQSCAAAWFIGNMVQQNCLSTGAFEVYYDGRTIFSKLATGQAPQLPEIVRAVAAAHVAAREALAQ